MPSACDSDRRLGLCGNPFQLSLNRSSSLSKETILHSSFKAYTEVTPTTSVARKTFLPHLVLSSSTQAHDTWSEGFGTRNNLPQRGRFCKAQLPQKLDQTVGSPHVGGDTSSSIGDGATEASCVEGVHLLSQLFHLLAILVGLQRRFHVFGRAIQSCRSDKGHSVMQRSRNKRLFNRLSDPLIVLRLFSQRVYARNRKGFGFATLHHGGNSCAD
mmetsp:Transcript_63913/g.169141  ORF Transcript_63913/g.169141 Transcript_63913/m.169141 type:complete len:214 (-) Transcript_63913:176-817(-)